MKLRELESFLLSIEVETWIGIIVVLSIIALIVKGKQLVNDIKREFEQIVDRGDTEIKIKEMLDDILNSLESRCSNMNIIYKLLIGFFNCGPMRRVLEKYIYNFIKQIVDTDGK